MDHDRWARAPVETVVIKLYENGTHVHFWLLLEALNVFVLGVREENFGDRNPL